MIVYLVGGPLHRREFRVSAELAKLHRLEIRLTSRQDGRPIRRELQKVAIYVTRPGAKPAGARFYIGMGDQAP